MLKRYYVASCRQSRTAKGARRDVDTIVTTVPRHLVERERVGCLSGAEPKNAATLIIIGQRRRAQSPARPAPRAPCVPPGIHFSGRGCRRHRPRHAGGYAVTSGY